MGSFSQEPLDSSLMGYSAEPVREGGVFSLTRTKSMLTSFEPAPAVYDDPATDPLRIDPFLTRSFSEIDLPPLPASLEPLFTVPSLEVAPLDDATDSSGPLSFFSRAERLRPHILKPVPAHAPLPHRFEAGAESALPETPSRARFEPAPFQFPGELPVHLSASRS